MALGPGFWTTFLYYFATTVVIAGITAGQALHISPLDPTAIQLGVVLGLLAGLGGSFFNRSVIWEVPIQGRKAFSNRLEQSLEGLKLELLEEDTVERELSEGEVAQKHSSGTDLLRVYGPSGAGAFFSGRLYVRLQDDSAELMGRASTIKKLKQLL